MIKVSIRQPERITCSVNKQTIPPVTAPLDITPTEQEQTFSPSGTVTGYTPVTVEAISATELSVIENGDYTPDENEYYKKVTVNVPEPTGTIAITENGAHDVTNYAIAEVDVTAEEVYYSIYGVAHTKNMILPNSVTSLTAQTYKACTYIESFVFPNTVTNLNVSSYLQWCGYLSDVTLPENATGALGSSFFYTCPRLDNVIIPNGITALGNTCFAYCTKLTTISIPSGVTNIPLNAFTGCTALKNITLGDGFLATINLNMSNEFTADDIVSMFNALGTVPSGSTRTFYLGATNLAKLTAEQKAIATDKGWTLS